MSGLEAVGAVASIVQLADFGARVAVKLHSFYHKINKADINIQRLSTDVSLTSSVLKQLGDILEDAKKQQLCSAEATSMANEIVKECDQVFQHMEATIDQDLKSKKCKNFKVGLSQKLNFAFSESEISVMQSQLDRLKATMLLLLHVMSYASQVRRRENEAVREEQEDMINTLLIEKELNEKNTKQASSTSTVFTATGGLDQEPSKSWVDQSKDSNSDLNELTEKASSLPSNEMIPRPIGRYFLLIQSLLRRIDQSKLLLGVEQRQRVRKGILDIQVEEEKRIRSKYGGIGDRVCDYLFSPETKSSRELPSRELPSRELQRSRAFYHTVDYCNSLQKPLLQPPRRPPSSSLQSDTDIDAVTSSPSEWITGSGRLGKVSSYRASPDSFAQYALIDPKEPVWEEAQLPYLPPKKEHGGMEEILLKWTTLTPSELAHGDKQ